MQNDQQNGQMPDLPPQPGVPIGSNPAPAPPRQPVPPAPPYWPPQPQRRSRAKRIAIVAMVIMLVFSALMNVYLLGLLVSQFRGGFRQATVSPGSFDQVVAVYRVSGTINSQAARQFSGFFEQVTGDANIKAVVLRVESPGGGVSASDQIHNFIKQLQATDRTVVVSMGGVAASGGYYISAPADEIVAEPTTVTGSIGVMMYWPVIRGALEKIGVETVLMKSSNARGWKDESSPFSMPAPYQREHLQAVLDEIQAKFEAVVREGRGSRLKPRPARYPVTEGDDAKAKTVEVSELEPLNGKIYLSDQAKQLGLIDHIGYLGNAIDRATDLAGLDKPKVIRYEIRRGLLAEVMDAKSPSLLSLSVESLDELQTPRILMMWKAE